MSLRRCIALGFTLLAVCAGTAAAQPAAIGSEPTGQPPKDWTFDFGPGVVVAPWFEGSAYWAQQTLALREQLFSAGDPDA